MNMYMEQQELRLMGKNNICLEDWIKRWKR